MNVSNFVKLRNLPSVSISKIYLRSLILDSASLLVSSCFLRRYSNVACVTVSSIIFSLHVAAESFDLIIEHLLGWKQIVFQSFS